MALRPRRDMFAYPPDWDPAVAGYDNVTLDLVHGPGRLGRSHGRSYGYRLAQRAPRRRVRVSQGRAPGPGRGTQPCAEVLELLADSGWQGEVVVEVSTRKHTPDQREVDLAEALAFARLAVVPTRGASRI